MLRAKTTTFKMWVVINEIVRASHQRSRVDVRAVTFEVLQDHQGSQPLLPHSVALT
jgi:hypothetical protein